MDADLRSAIARDKILHDRRRLATALIVIAVLLFVAAWFAVPSGIAILMLSGSMSSIPLLGGGVLAAAGGAIVLIVGLRMRRAVARDIHSPSSTPGKPDPHYQQDPAFVPSHNPPSNWTGMGPGGASF